MLFVAPISVSLVFLFAFSQNKWSILSTERDNAVQCICFMIMNILKSQHIWVSFILYKRPASPMENILHYLPTKAALWVLKRNKRQKNPKTDDRKPEKGRIMLEGHHIPGLCSEKQAGFSSRPSPSLPLWSSAPLCLLSLRMPFERDSIFTFATYKKNTIEISRRWQLLSSKIETDIP